MVTLGSYETTTQKIVNKMEIYGLADDTKPVSEIDDIPIVNGAKYIEIDTAKVYLYDAENETWYPENEEA